MNNKLVVGKHEFEIVDFIPYGYKIWNIGHNMADGYLPLVTTGGYDGCQVIGVMKAMPLKDAKKILSVTCGYGSTPKQLKKSIEKYTERGDRPEKVQQMKQALEIMLTIKGIENLTK